MSVQEMLALSVVLGTVALFVRAALRRRRQLPWQRGSHCGCGTSDAGANGGGEPQIIRISGRKGEVPHVTVTTSKPKLARTQTVD